MESYEVKKDIIKNFSFEDMNKSDFHIFEIILTNENCIRNEIINHSIWGISKTDRIIKSLHKKGIIISRKDRKNIKGRNYNIFSIYPGLGYFLGLELNVVYDRFALTDFIGHPLSTKEYPASYAKTDPISEVKKHIADFINQNNVELSDIKGIGIGLHGLVDLNRGVIHRILYKDQEIDLNIKNHLEKEFGIKIFIAQPKVLALFGEYRFNSVLSGKTVLNVNAGYGIGLGIFFNGKYFQGVSGMAGQLAHLIVPGNTRKCYCGNTGCLRTLISYKAICVQAKEKINSGFSSKINPEKISGPFYEEGLEHIIDMALNNDKLCIHLIHDVGISLGTALSYVVCLFNPELLIIHSNIVRAGELFTVPVITQMRKNTLEFSMTPLNIKFKQREPFSVCIGGAVFCLKEILTSYKGK